VTLIKLVIYDDYNHRVCEDQNVIGTITPTCGFSAFTNGKKLIEVYAVGDEDDNTQ
jgi:hypothetical protein